MKNSATKSGNKKMIVLVAVILAAIAILGVTVISIGGGSQSAAEHGHSHN